jgi:hypothetical protein
MIRQPSTTNPVPNVKGLSGVNAGGAATIAWLPLAAEDNVVGVVVQHSTDANFVDDFSMLIDSRNVLVGANIHEVPEASELLWRCIAYTLRRESNEVSKA